MLSCTHAKLESLLKALANEKRLALLRELKRARTGMSVNVIAKRIGLSFRMTSKHLAQLATAGILERRRRGKFTLYRLSLAMPEPARSTVGLL